jgi:hypothetical protein
MQKTDTTTHRGARLCLSLILGLFGLFTVGCGDLLHIQTSPPADTLALPGEETPISIEEITGLPEHAPTVTIEERVIETGISADPLETPFSPTSDPTSGEGGLIDANPYIPEADILIMKPGDFSIVVSPFRISAYLEPDPNHLVDLRLVGEDGRTLSEKSIMVFPWEGATHATMVSLIEFEIPPGTMEAARMEISVNDEFGRPRAMNSIELILMSEGMPMRNYAESLKEEVVIQYPLDNTLIQGEALLLSGLVKVRSEKPLLIELITETGEVIGSSEAAVLLPEEGDYAIFATQVHYDISEPTWVRLVIRVPSARIPGTAYIKTRVLLLYP